MVQTRSGRTIESTRNDKEIQNLTRTVERHPPAKKRRRGKPVEICQLNLDVLFLIAAYIKPIDLLNLARACKSLRNLLMDKSSTFVWKTTRHQVKGLPGCPADLTEPEYANLVFYARCHGCGKYAKNVLWKMRLRYCRDCKISRLCSLSLCHEIIRTNTNLIAMEHITIEGETTFFVDKEQIESFIQEYERSSNRVQFLRDQEKKQSLTCMHARQCEEWQGGIEYQHKIDLRARRQERTDSIFNRLEQLGYLPEINYFGHFQIQKSCKTMFGKSTPLTDKEWNQSEAGWLETMNNFRAERLQRVVYPSRRRELASEYDDYVACPSPNSASSDLLPHAVEIACFPPFRDIVRSPEGTQMNDKPFESAFLQLPEFIEGWRKTVDAELAELIKIPSQLSSKNGRIATSSSKTGSEALQLAKLRLACAIFYCDRCFVTYPEVLSVSMRDHFIGQEPEHTGSICTKYVRYVAEAPHIIHACGLDPTVATVVDMDHQNARLKCLSCSNSCILTWKQAILHAHSFHRNEAPYSDRWQIISDEHMLAIQAAELPLKKQTNIQRSWCLLCRRRVGDARYHYETTRHLLSRHKIEDKDAEEGTHYATLSGSLHGCVEIVEDGGEVSFKEARLWNWFRYDF